MSAVLTSEERRAIRKLAEDLADDQGWAALGMDLRQMLADHGLPCGDRAERELSDRLNWLLG